MEEINEDDLIIYEESKEIKESLWKIWDIINDQKIVLKFLLNTSLLKYLKSSKTQNEIIFDSIEKNKDKDNEENKIEENNNNNINIEENNKAEEDGN